MTPPPSRRPTRSRSAPHATQDRASALMASWGADRYRQIQQYRRSPACRARRARAVTSPRNGSTSAAGGCSQNSSVRTHCSATAGSRLGCTSANASRSSSDSCSTQGPSSPLHGHQLPLRQLVVGDPGQQRVQPHHHDRGLEALAEHRINRRRIRVSWPREALKHCCSGRRICRTEVVEQDAHGPSRPSTATTAERYGAAPTR
jgi:hypothetical protein